MKLKHLAIQTLPGISPGFELSDFGPGVNVITGPNAVGKSSLVRALRYLVTAPERGDPQALALIAEFDHGGHWRVQRTGSTQVWEHDGEPGEAPALPDRDALQCYWLSMEGLIEAGAGDERLVAMLRRELTGGFDLRALRSGEFEPRPRIGQREERELHEAEKAVRAAENHYRQLALEEAELPGLRRDIDAARAAAVRREGLAAALRLVEIRAEHERLQAGLAQFPEGMDRLHGDELDGLARLDKRRDGYREELETARRAHAEASAKLQATGLETARPQPDELEAQRARLGEIQSLRDRLKDLRERFEEAHATEVAARKDLGGHESPPALTPEAVSRAEQLARDLQQRQACREELIRRIEDAGERPAEDEINRHVSAAEALRAWQAVHQTDGVPWPAWAVIATGALVAIAGGIGTWIGLGWGVWTGWAGAAGGAASLAGTAWALHTSRGDRDADARQRFAATGLAEPADWDRAAVATRLAEFDRYIAELHRRRDRAAAAAEERSRLAALERELAKWKEERDQLAGELGFDPALTAQGFDHFVRLGQAWREARSRVEGLAREIRRLDGESKAASEAVRAFLVEWGREVEADPAHLHAALDGLVVRCKQAYEAARDIAERSNDIERAERHLREVEEERAALFERVGLEAGARDALRARLERLEDYQAQCRCLEDVQRREAEVHQELAGQDALLERVDAGEAVDAREREALRAEHDELEQRAGQLEALQERRTEIQTRLAEAGADRRLERALGERDAARERLAERRDEVLLAEAGQCLLDDIEAEYRNEHEPDVLRDARERFRRFTHHAWDVELDVEGGTGLAARDLRQGARRELGALSSGTRMQLLLAVRLAWIEHLERNVQALPLFLDEALTTSDEERFARVVESLEQLATEEDRQVFYLSARRHELALWERVTGNRPHHLDLARARFGADSAAGGELVVTEPEPLPRPDGQSPGDYAERLGVPPVNPRRAEGDLHLFHLLRDDLGLLHELMEKWAIDRLGPLDSLLASNAAAAALPDSFRRHTLTGRSQAARAWIAVWRRGRGRPVDRIVLEQSGAVSEKYLDGLSGVAADHGGDPRKLLQALRERSDERLKGFRRQKVEELETWLTENGYLDTEDPLDRDEREHRTLLAAGERADPEAIRRVVAWLEAGVQ